MFSSHEDSSIIRYEGEFNVLQRGLDSLKPFEFIDEPTVISDLSSIIARVRLWQDKLPRVSLFHPVKCNNDPIVLRVLDRLGVKFSCASKDEIRSMRMKGVSADDLLFANPVKIISHLRCAEKQRVGLLVIDSLDELEKVKMYHPDAKLLLKIKFNGSTSSYSGCDPKTDALKLMMEAKNLDLNLLGITFNNGTNNFDPEDYKSMLITTRTLFDYGRGILSMNLTTICIGGGIPANIDSDTFSHFAAVISKLIAEFFPEPSIRVLAEPGEFLVGPAMTLFCTVQARKEIIDSNGDVKQMVYYLNHLFTGELLGTLRPKCIVSEPQEDNRILPSVFMGAMSESNGMIAHTLLPVQFVGDVFYFENYGGNLEMANKGNYGGFRPPIVQHYLKQSCKIIL